MRVFETRDKDHDLESYAWERLFETGVFAENKDDMGEVLGADIQETMIEWLTDWLILLNLPIIQN